MATTTTRKETKKSPAAKIRVGTAVCTVWENEGENGRAYYSTTCVRVYKNDQDEYVESNSFLDGQLLELAKAADLAHTWVIEQQAKERAERRG